ncbi:MAG: methylated-DNA--[protein]-cysteine S-methyltransferase [Actinobacteria bacterium]|nr:methylated-DNA--[protein]-cysteine S-methyltransferase [Actinomycetota bacterium]
MTTIETTTMTTPVGPLTLLAAEGALVAAGFTGDAGDLRSRLRSPLRDAPLRRLAGLGDLSGALASYFDGDLGAPTRVPAVQTGTVGQRRVWEVLRALPPGRTVTYARLASQAGYAGAARAAGAACGANLLAPVVPCHRAVRSDGTMGGYAYGPPVKRWLLDHERRHVDRDVRSPA